MIIFRNLSIALLVWCAIWFLHGFFRELYRTIKRSYEDWENKKRILHEIVGDKAIEKKLIEWGKRKDGSIRIMVGKEMKIIKHDIIDKGRKELNWKP